MKSNLELHREALLDDHLPCGDHFHALVAPPCHRRTFAITYTQLEATVWMELPQALILFLLLKSFVQLAWTDIRSTNENIVQNPSRILTPCSTSSRILLPPPDPRILHLCFVWKWKIFIAGFQQIGEISQDVEKESTLLLKYHWKPVRSWRSDSP